MVRAFIDVFPTSVLLSGTQAELLLLGTTGDRIDIDPGKLTQALENAPKVLEDLPRRMLEALWARTARVGRNPVDGLVKSDMRLFPVKKAHKLLSKRIQWLAHGASLCSKRTTAVCGSQV